MIYTGHGFMEEDMAEILLTKEQIEQRVRELGQEIARDYAGREVIMICVLKGACVFYTDLARATPIHMKMDFMAISSYGDAQKTSGIVSIKKDIDSSITGKDMISSTMMISMSSRSIPVPPAPSPISPRLPACPSSTWLPG